MSSCHDVIPQGPVYIQRKKIQVWTKRFPLLLLTWKTHLCNVAAAARVPLGKLFGWDLLGRRRWLEAGQTKCVTKQSVLCLIFCQQTRFILSSHGAVNVISAECETLSSIIFWARINIIKFIYAMLARCEIERPNLSRWESTDWTVGCVRL